MSNRLKVTINCEDCGAERLITKACLSLVNRCKPCQKIFNRDRARNRYRELKGIPVDKPVTQIIKKKEKNRPAEIWPKEPVGKMAEEEEKKVEPARTPEEEARRKKVLEELFSTLGGETDDDW